MDTENSGADRARAQQDEPKIEPPDEVNKDQEEAINDTPMNIRSSPPPLPDILATGERSEQSAADAKSDSEAETVLLPGVDGYSPSKIRKTIKLEDKPNDLENLENIKERDDDLVEHQQIQNARTSSTTLGKRKRSKNGNNRSDHQHGGHSSGLSSVPTSPVGISRPNQPNSIEVELTHYRSPSPTLARKHEKADSEGRGSPHREEFSAASGEEKKTNHSRITESSGVSTAGEQAKDRKEQQPTSQTEDIPKKQNRVRSNSPALDHHRRSISNQFSGNSATTLPKKKRPGPLRTTRDRQSYDNHSDDDSSVGESPHPRRSRTRNLATPPTGDSASFAKMPKRRRLLYGSSALAVACEHGDVDRARQELREAPEDLNSADNAGNTPLQCASINGHADVVMFLIDEGCDIHCVNNRKDSPLLDAVENGHLEVVKVLLAAGVNPRARNLEGEEPINKIDEDDDDADAIRDALLAARPRAVASESATPSLPPPVHAAQANHGSTNPRTLSHGRSRRTGENQLFIQLNVTSLRQAASVGDLETTLRIMEAIGVRGLDDSESLVNAAKGGHEDVLQLLMALGDANPDPRPLPHKDPEYATPILAAIGGDNIGVIKLLLGKIEDGKFDPTRKYNGRTYYEIARERAGPHWQEEERALKEEFDKYDPSAHRGEANAAGSSRSAAKRHHDDRTNGVKRHPTNSGVHSSRRDHKGQAPSTTDEIPVKRGPGRPRKEGRERSVMSDHDTSSLQKKATPKRADSDTATLPSEAEPAKDQRKRMRLISAKDLKNRMERRASIASTMSADEPSTNVLISQSIESVTDRHADLIRSVKHDESEEGLLAVQAESIVKRPRSSPSPSIGQDTTATTTTGSDHAKTNKRRRLESHLKDTARPKSCSSLSPEPGIGANSTQKTKNANEKVHNTQRPAAVDVDGHDGDDARRNETVQTGKSIKIDGLNGQMNSAASTLAGKQRRGSDAAAATEEAMQIEASVERQAKEESERQKQEMARLAQEEEERRERMELAKAEEAKVLEQQRKEAARLEAEEAERREQRRRAEAEAHAKAEEERRRLYNEQQRIQREEQERRRAAHIAQQRAERQRVLQEEKNARLAKLPPLLRWFDGVENPLTPDFAYMFRSLQGVRYDTIRQDATGTPEGKEQWLLNVQVALLLGEKELAFPRYTHWTHLEVSDPAKRTLWKVLSEDYSLISEHLRLPAGLPRGPDGTLSSKMRNEAWPIFQAYPMFFVRLSDFMSIVPRYPHLKGIEMLIKYRELPPNDFWLTKVAFPPKWKQDEDSGTRFGFCPGTKHYINGVLVREDKPKISQTSSTPFPSQRVPRIGGIHEVFPSNPSYERLCKEQGLQHLLPGTGENGLIPHRLPTSATPPESNATNEDDLRRLSATSSIVSVPTTDKIINGIKELDQLGLSS